MRVDVRDDLAFNNRRSILLLEREDRKWNVVVVLDHQAHTVFQNVITPDGIRYEPDTDEGLSRLPGWTNEEQARDAFRAETTTHKGKTWNVATQ